MQGNGKVCRVQTFVEFAREKEGLFDRWCTSQKVESKEDLKQLILLEDFKNCLPETVTVYLNEQKAKRLDEAAVLAEEYVLTHKRVSERCVNYEKNRNFSHKNRQPNFGDITLYDLFH